MATTFLEPGGDADFGIALWNTSFVTPAVATDFVHGAHQRSIKYRAGFNDGVAQSGILADSGSRVSLYIYLNAAPNATASIIAFRKADTTTNVVVLRLTSGRVLQLWNVTTSQIGSNGATLNTGRWYRISMAYTITSTTVNRFEVFVDGVSSISVTNATITNTLTNTWAIGNHSTNSTLDMRSSDHYVDNSNSLTDPGNIWVTAKRPVSNGTTNGFTTQIGSGGSGYGSGHAPQVNERPLSTTNGWSAVVSGVAATEEYTIEAASVGDIDISSATLLDYMGWLSAKALNAETGSLVLAGATTNVSLTTTITIFKAIGGSSTYPAGGTDIGLTTTTLSTTVSLYECGLVFAFIPATGGLEFLQPISQPTRHYLPDIVTV